METYGVCVLEHQEQAQSYPAAGRMRGYFRARDDHLPAAHNGGLAVIRPRR